MITSTSHLLIDEVSATRGKLGVMTLNRPRALNALTREMSLHIMAQLVRWQQMAEIQAVIIRSAEGRAFCAGGDILQLYKHGPAWRAQSELFFKDEYALNRTLFNFPKPYISFLDGITMGGGLGISLHGSHPIGTENTVLATPETGIGFFPDVGATYVLSRLRHHYGFYLGLTGAHIRLGDAMHVSLVRHAVRCTELERLFKALTQVRWSEDPFSQVDDVLEGFEPPNESLEAPLAEHREVIDRSFSQKTVEGILVQLDKERSAWAQTVKRVLLQRCPTSLKVTLMALQRAEKTSFDECMVMDGRLSRYFLGRSDFYEGVRCALVDKSDSPTWQPATLAEVQVDGRW